MYILGSSKIETLCPLFARFWFILSLAQALGKAWISNSKRIVPNITLGGQVLNIEVADDHNKNVNDNVDDNEDDDDENRSTRARQGPLCGFPMSALWLLILDPLKLFLTLLENRVHLGHFRKTNASTFFVQFGQSVIQFFNIFRWFV